MSKWVLVTGAAKRIGRAIALDLSNAGYDIIVHYHTSQSEAEELAAAIRKSGREACLAEIDLRKPKLIENLIPSLIDALGPLTALVNNASLFEPDTEDSDGQHHMAINTVAPRLLSEAFFTYLPKDREGSIVNILDAAPTKTTFSHYNASKIALARATRHEAQRFAPHVRVNGVALGAVLPSPRESTDHFQKLAQSAPLGVQVSAEAVAATVRFLIENPFITGEVVHVDAGAHLHRASDLI